MWSVRRLRPTKKSCVDCGLRLPRRHGNKPSERCHPCNGRYLLKKLRKRKEALNRKRTSIWVSLVNSIVLRVRKKICH